MGVGQETKLQEWFHLPEDMASPRSSMSYNFYAAIFMFNITFWPLGAVESKMLRVVSFLNQKSGLPAVLLSFSHPIP